MRWFRRRQPAVPNGAVIEIDGVRYDGRAMFGPPRGRGQWQRFADRVRRSYSALTVRGPVEDRAITSVPWSRGDALIPTSASQAQALRLGAVWSAVRLICDAVATLPVKSYRRTGETRTPAVLPQLLRQLDDDGTLVPWLWRCVSSLMLRGNAYGLITARDGMQFPTVIQWLDPDEVSCDDTNPWVPVWYWRGQVVPTVDFIHIPWFVVAGKTQGLSPIEAYAMSVSTGLQAQEYGATWFGNGGVPPGTMRNTRQTIDRTQAEAISDRVVASIKRRRPLVFGADWEFSPIQVAPEEAQFLETIKATASEIAAIYGIPPEYVGGSTGDSMTYANVEQNQLRLLQSIRPVLVRVENALSAQMPNKQRVKFNADATARADLKTRLESYQIGLAAGIYTLDEVRAYEDLPPLPPGARPPVPTDPAQRKFNPNQPRDPDGQFSDGVFDLGNGMPKLVVSHTMSMANGAVRTESSGDGKVRMDIGGRSLELRNRRERTALEKTIKAARFGETSETQYGGMKTTTRDGKPYTVPTYAVRPVGEQDDDGIFRRVELVLAEPGDDYAELDSRKGLELNEREVDQLTGQLDADMAAARVDTGYGPLDVYSPDPGHLALRMKDEAGKPTEVQFSRRDWNRIYDAMDLVIEGFDEKDPNEDAPEINHLQVKTAAGPVDLNWRGPHQINGYSPEASLSIVPAYDAPWSVVVDGPHMSDTFGAIGDLGIAMGIHE